MPRTIRTKVYKFNELTKKIQSEVIDNLRYVNVEDNDWYEPTEDYFLEEIADPAGFEVGKMYVSGYASQGDGAMFEGRVKDFTPFIKDINPHVKKAIEKGAIALSWSVKHSGHYHHEYCSAIDYETGDNYPVKYLGECEWKGNIYEELQKVGEIIKEAYYTLCRKFYKMLEEEYDGQTSDEAVKETIESNDWEFTREGKRI